MGKLAIRVLTLAIGATAVALVPAITPAAAKASRHVHHMHMKKHGWYRTYPYRGAWVVPPAQPMAVPYRQPGPICPAVGHSFDCKIWPPPFEDDPDRKTSKF